MWEQLGGYDDLFAPAYYEDADFALQVKDKGWRVIFNPFSKIVHYEGVSCGTDVNTGVKQYQEINKEKFYQKWQTTLAKQPAKPDAEGVNQYVRETARRGWILWIDSNTPTPDKDAGSMETISFLRFAMNSSIPIARRTNQLQPFFAQLGHR